MNKAKSVYFISEKTDDFIIGTEYGEVHVYEYTGIDEENYPVDIFVLDMKYDNLALIRIFYNTGTLVAEWQIKQPNRQ